MDYEKLTKEFEKLKTDKDRWKWIAAHQDTGIIVYLDNDDTFACFDSNEWDGECLQINEYCDGPGVCWLLEAMGIRSEEV